MDIFFNVLKINYEYFLIFIMRPNVYTKFENNLNHDFIVSDTISSSSKDFYREKIFVNYSILFLKLCLFALAMISLIKISYISKIRVNRLREIKKSYFYEKEKFANLSNRFDDLFSLKGEQRFMKDQHQMISRDLLRVIWR